MSISEVSSSICSVALSAVVSVAGNQRSVGAGRAEAVRRSCSRSRCSAMPTSGSRCASVAVPPGASSSAGSDSAPDSCTSGTMPLWSSDDAGRGVVARGGQLQGAAAGQRHDGLHRSLAVGAAADQQRARVVVQRRREDLRGRGRTAVDQHGDRRAAAGIAGRGAIDEARLVAAPVGADDDAALEQLVSDRDRGIEHAAGVVAQVDDQAGQRASPDRRAAQPAAARTPARCCR